MANRPLCTVSSYSLFTRLYSSTTHHEIEGLACALLFGSNFQLLLQNSKFAVLNNQPALHRLNLVCGLNLLSRFQDKTIAETNQKFNGKLFLLLFRFY